MKSTQKSPDDAVPIEMMRIRTYLDTGVLLAVVRSEPDTGVRAYNVLNDPRREFVTSSMLALELLPSPIYFQRSGELLFCKEYLSASVDNVPLSQDLFDEAFKQASAHGLAAVDSLHVSAAILAGVEEFITTEKPTKPIYRTEAIKVIPL